MPEEKPRGLYEGLGLPDRERTRRPQKRALTEAIRPVSRAEFNQVLTMIGRMQAELDMLREHAHYTNQGFSGGPEDRR